MLLAVDEVCELAVEGRGCRDAVAAAAAASSF